MATGTYPHLPPGHAPGPQTRAALRRRRARQFLGLIGGLCLVGIAVGVLVNRDPQESAGRTIGPVAILVGFAVLMFGLVWLLSRVRHTPRAKHLGVDVDRSELRRGGDVVATLSVRDPAAVAGELQLGLVCVERYDEQRGGSGPRSVSYRATTEGTVAEQWVPVEVGAVLSRTFSIPPAGIVSYEGECLSYAWRVSGREVRAHRRDRRVDAPIWVSM